MMCFPEMPEERQNVFIIADIADASNILQAWGGCHTIFEVQHSPRLLVIIVGPGFCPRSRERRWSVGTP